MQPIIQEATINAKPPVVWKAISDKAQMQEWYFDIKEFELKVGYEFEFIGYNEDKSKEYLHLCKITDVIENKKLAYTWRYSDSPEDSHLTFELFDNNDHTLIRLTHVDTDKLGDNPAYVRENFIAGWETFITKLLKEYVERQ